MDNIDIDDDDDNSNFWTSYMPPDVSPLGIYLDNVKKQFKKHPLLELEYFTIADEATLQTANNINSDKKYRAFIAVFAGKIRLIDNLRLETSNKRN